MTVFNHITGKISEMDTVFFKRIMRAVGVVRVQIVLGLAGTMSHAEKVLIVQHLENVFKRQDPPGVINGFFYR